MPKTKVSSYGYEDSSGEDRTQYRTTVPKQLVEALDLEGATLEWEQEEMNELRVKIERSDD